MIASSAINSGQAVSRFCARRAGFTLLEVLAALMLLAVGAAAVLALARQVTATISRTEAREMAVVRASAFLDFVSLWPREDLDRHLGERPEGSWTLRIERPWPDLYRVTLLDGATQTAELETALYRPMTNNEVP